MRTLWRACLVHGDTLVSPHMGTRWMGPVLWATAWSDAAAVRGEAGIHGAWRVTGSDLPRPLTGHALVRIAAVPGTRMARAPEGARCEAVIVRQIVAPWWVSDTDVRGLERRYQCTVTRRRPRPDLLAQQMRLAQDPSEWERMYLAANPALIPAVQPVLAQDPNRRVRENLAANPALIPALQPVLAQDPNGRVRENLAANPALIPALQPVLAQDPNGRVRESLAGNPALIPALQPVLAQDPNAWVRRRLAGNPAYARQVTA